LTADEVVEICASSEDPEAWQEFQRRFQKLIASVVMRICHRRGETSSAVSDDLVQDTYVKVCADERRLLRQFKSQHPDAFYGMLKVTAANAARDYFRARDADKRGARLIEVGLEDVESFVPDRHSAGSAQIEREILIQEIDRILLEKCSARDRQIFWLHYRQGLTAEEIAAIPSLKVESKGLRLETKAVESALHRLRLLVRGALVEARVPASQARPEAEGISGSNPFTKGEGHR
jgi:RNA polymerase sigma factor (sigma-70 family)